MESILSFFKAKGTKVYTIFATKKLQRKILLLFLILLGTVKVSYSQRGNYQYDEIGGFIGIGYYNGEICPVKPLYNPQLAFGLNFRHGFNDRLALSFQALRCVLKGDDNDFDNEYQKARNLRFENEIIELSLQMEFNFLPLKKGSKYNFISPYIAAGPGLVIGSFPHEGLQFCIPFGLGVKISPTQKFTLSFEWKYRKMFTDMLDHINDDLYDPQYGVEYTKQRSFLGNDDMYSFIGAVFSFQIGSTAPKQCGAYR
ncbi:MAG: DUF6089 family protein [Bacteroidales bacterium]|nr:DUF6089 family protein [Bacteroidales bacterium]